MIPRLLTLQDALIAYDLRKDEIQGLTQEDFITTQRVSTVYERRFVRDTESVFRSREGIMADLEELERVANTPLPLYRIDDEQIRSFDVMISGQKRKIIPADITLLYFAEIYQVLSGIQAVPQVINFQGTVAQLVPLQFTKVEYDTSKTTGPLRYSTIDVGRVTKNIDEKGFVLLEKFPGFLRNNFEHGDYKTKTKASRANTTNIEISGIDTQTLQHYMNILEANRQRIIREKIPTRFGGTTLDLYSLLPLC